MAPNTKKPKTVKKIKAKKLKIAKPSPPIRLTVDDPVNDIFDDEIYDDETIIPKEIITENENFEKPW